MSSVGLELEEIIDIGNKFVAAKYYALATTTIFFYDFLLTLGDEVKYAWQGRKSWVFAIFLAVLAGSIPNLVFVYGLWYTIPLTGHDSVTPQTTSFHTRFNYRCDKTVFLEALAFVGVTFLAQVVLTLRIYALTSKNRIIISCFCLITISQFALGLQTVVYAAKAGPSPTLQIPLPVYTACVMRGQFFPAIGLLATSLAYDLLAFLVIVYLAIRSKLQNVPTPSLFRIIARDATFYFLVISTSHIVLVIIVLVMFLVFTSVFQLLPTPGHTVFLPVMITRLLLSLREAASSQDNGWSLGEPTTHTTMRFAERRGGVSTRDGILLDTFASTHEGTQIQE